MIYVNIGRNSEGHIHSLTVKNHGESIVCAAVSILTLNTVNSIEVFCDIDFICDYNEKGGYLSLDIPKIKNGLYDSDVDILLKAFVLGISSIKEEYGNISIKDRGVL